MKVLLKVGNNTYLLGSDAGLQTVVKALSQAVLCHDRSYRTPAEIKAESAPMEVSVKYLPPKTRIRFVENIWDADAAAEETDQLCLVAPTAIIPPPQPKA